MWQFYHFGLALLVGLGGFFYWQRWLGRYPLPLKAILALLAAAVPLVLLGGHLAYYVVSRPAAAPFFLTFAGWRSGYHSLGSLCGIAVAVVIVARAQRLPALYLFDLFAPAVFIVSAIWRLGCFFHGCCYGAPTSLPWGVSFTIVRELGIRTLPSHPVQLYEATASVALFLLLLPLAARCKARPGSGLLAGLVVLLYSSERFALEFFRIGGTTHAVAGGLSPTQLITGGLMLAVGALLILAVKFRQPNKPIKTGI